MPDDPSIENVIEISFPITSCNSNNISGGYELLFRHNRGRPPNKIAPKVEEQRSIYLIANYVSMKNLSEPFKNFTKEISLQQIPTNVEKTLTNSKWVQATKE